MGFSICGAKADHTIDLTTELILNPGPTHPKYPERISYTLQETDAAPVSQRQKLPSGEYKWVWVNYNDFVPRYETQYWALFNEQAHVRRSKGKSPYVYLREDVTGNFGKYSLVTNKIEPGYIRCLITFVGRSESDKGGNVSYPTTEVRFVINDPTILDTY